MFGTNEMFGNIRHTFDIFDCASDELKKKLSVRTRGDGLWADGGVLGDVVSVRSPHFSNDAECRLFLFECAAE